MAKSRPSLDEIVQGITKTTDLVGEIAAASKEQAQGVDQINTAVSQMDKVTQQNAANAEESASASEELSAKAETMMQIVDELVALVNGSSAQKLASAPRKTGGKKGETLGHLDHAFHHIANGEGAKEKSVKMNKATVTSKLPLNDSEFNSFNG